MPAIFADTTASAALNDSTPKSYILPVDSPLASDLNLDSSTSFRSARRSSRPPTAGRGPLNSHPALEDDHIPPMPGAFPIDNNYTHTSPAKNPTDGVMSSESNRDTSGSFQTPTSPSSAQDYHPPERRPSGVRRLFSLSSLRQSFSSSRTSLSIAPGSSYGRPSTSYASDSQARPPTAMSTTASTMQAPSMHSTMHSSRNPATLRKKRSSNWFKRKSGFFAVNEDGVLDMVNEDGPQTKRFKALPVLPEVSALSGGDLNEGSLGWDEDLFKR